MYPLLFWIFEINYRFAENAFQQKIFKDKKSFQLQNEYIIWKYTLLCPQRNFRTIC